MSDKPEKSKIRPVLIVSNDQSNQLDNDFLIIPITSKLRQQPFEILLTAQRITQPLPELSAVRCNKMHTIRNTRIIGKISSLTPDAMLEVVSTIEQVIAFRQSDLGYGFTSRKT